MKPKSRVIGDPLKKFKKGPSIIQEAPEHLRKEIEALMEEDHKRGQPFHSVHLVSSLTGLPDKWWFDKARALGHVFEDERAFWQSQKDAVSAEVDALPPEEREELRKQAEILMKTHPELMGVPVPKVEYTWEQVGSLKKLPAHESIPPEQKGTFFAMSTIRANTKMVLNSYLKWGIQAVQDLVTEYMSQMSQMTDKVKRDPKLLARISSNPDEQLKILLDEVDWKAVEDVLKVGAAEFRQRAGEMRIQQVLGPLRYRGTPGELYNKKTGRGAEN